MECDEQTFGISSYVCCKRQKQVTSVASETTLNEVNRMLSLTRGEFSLRAKLQSKFYEHVLSRSGFINANWIYMPWTWSAVNKRRITRFPVIFRELSRGLPSSQRFVKIWWHRSTEAGEPTQWMAERRRSVNKTRTWLIIDHFQYLEIYHSEYSIYFRVSITCYSAKILHLLEDFLDTFYTNVSVLQHDQ